MTEKMENTLLELQSPSRNIPKGVKQAIHLPGNGHSEEGYLFVRFFHGGQDVVPALLFSFSTDEYVVRKYPQYSPFITSTHVPKGNRIALLNQDEVTITKELSRQGLSPQVLHFEGDKTRTANFTIQVL